MEEIIRASAIIHISRFGRAQGSLLPNRLTGRQAPLKGRTLRVRFVSVGKELAKTFVCFVVLKERSDVYIPYFKHKTLYRYV